MKKWTPPLLKMCLVVILMHFFVFPVCAAPAEDAVLYSFTAYDGDLYSIDTSDYSYSLIGGVNGDTGPVETINGADVDPNTNEVYIVVSFNYDRRTRYLATIDMETRDITTIGNLNDKFAAIAFDDSGTLYGLTGAGADQDSSLFAINTEDASTTLLAEYNNDNGEALAFNEDDGLLYRATGDKIYSIDPKNPSEETLVMSNWDLNGPEGFYHNGGMEFIYGDWDDIYIVDIAEDSVTYVGNMYDGTKTYFYWPVEKSVNIENRAPQNNSSTADIDEDLVLTFDRLMFPGSGNIAVRKYEDDSVVETIDVNSDRVTGWEGSVIMIDPIADLSHQTKYYVLIDAGAIVDESDVAFSGFSAKDDWVFTTRSSGNDFDFDDSFTSLDFVDEEQTDAQWRQGEGYFTLGGAAGIWTYADRETAGKENIQNDWTSTGEDPQIVLNDADEQMIVWEQNGVIMFTWWDGEGGRWSSMDGVQTGAEDLSSIDAMGCAGTGSCYEAHEPQIIADENGHPIVAWIGEYYNGTVTERRIFVRRWNASSSAWTTMNGSQEDADIVLPFDNDLMMAENTTFHMIASSDAQPMIASDIMDIPNGERNVFYAEWNGTEWTGRLSSDFDVLRDESDTASSVYLARDASDNPYFVWLSDIGNSGARFTHWNGSDYSSLGSGGGAEYDAFNFSNASGWPRIGIDSEDRPILVYSYSESGTDAIVLEKWSGAAWDAVQFDDQYAANIELVIDSNDIPIVAWGHWGDELRVSQVYDNDWYSMGNTVGYDVVKPSSGYSLNYFDLEINSSDQPLVVWSMRQAYSAHFSMWNGSAWVRGDGETSGDDSLSGDTRTGGVEMVINSVDEPSVVWTEEWGDADVHFSVLPIDIESPKTVQSTKINGTITGIVSASLTATEHLNGGSRIEYFLSGDGGNNWQGVENGGEVTFDSANDLRWRAVLHKGSVPNLMEVHVDFQTQGANEPEPEELCECYVMGSTETDHPDATVLYSDDGGTTWTYTPVDNGSGMDCYVTNVKLLRDQTSESTDAEIVESDFTGISAQTRVVNNIDGEVVLQDYSIGTHTFGSPYEDDGNDVAVDSVGNFYVTGFFNNTVNFDDTGGTDIHSTGGTSNEHLYITKYNADHSYGWTRSIGSNGDVRGYGIAIDADDNVIVAGGFAGTVDFDHTSGTDMRSSSGSWDVFISKHNADGTYAWTRTFGGSNSDMAYGVDVDDSGNISITGSFSSTMDFDATSGTDTHSVTLNQYNDVFTTKYNSDGSYGWTHTFGNNMADYPRQVAVNGSGDVYVTGWFQSRIDFDDTGGVDMHGNWNAFDSFYDVYVTKYNANGSYGWTRTIGTEVVSGGSGRGSDEGRGIAIDDSGNVYVTGMYVGSIDFDTTGGTDERTSNGEDAFLTKFAADGSYVWTRTFGGSDEDAGYAVSTDSSGNIYVTGYFETDFDPDGSGSAQSRSAVGLDDAFIVRYDADGSYNWSHVFGGNTYDHGNGIVLDNNDDAFIVGRYRDTVNFDDDGGIDENTSNGNYDVFVTKYNSDGSYGAYASFYASSGTYQTMIDSTGVLNAWSSFTADEAVLSNTDISYEIQDPGCSSTFVGPTSDTTIDLSSISTAHSSLCLTATLSTTDTSITPALNEWTAVFVQDQGVTEEEVPYETLSNPKCAEPKEPGDIVDEDDEDEEKECSFDAVRDVAEDSVTLRVSVDDSYAGEKVKFKVEVEDLYINKKETIKISDKPSDNGKATLVIDGLEEDTQYRFKVSYDEDDHDGYLYCPHSKTRKTNKTGVITKDDSERYPECGNASKTYKKDATAFTGAFCAIGAENTAPPFPASGEKVTWTCSIDGNTEECHARKEDDIVLPPIHGGSQSGEDLSGGVLEVGQEFSVPEDPLQATAVLGLVTGTMVAFATSAVPLFTTLPMATKDFFIMPFLGILARRKNEQNWGTVFESTTKQPIPGTKLTLMDPKGKEVETTYSDVHGRFGFLTASGSYIIQIEKAKFAPNYDHEIDSLYGDVYTGGVITIDENKVIATNIALSAKDIDWSEYAKKKTQAYKGFFSLFKKWLFIVLFYVGFMFTGIVAYLYPSWINYTLLGLYIGLFVYDNFVKHKKYGTVAANDKKPIPFAIVSLHERDTSAKKSFAVTDVIGRYYLLAENGGYHMKVKGQPVGGHNFEKQGEIHVRDGLVRKDIRV